MTKVENRCGVIPKDTKCLVLPDPVGDKIGSIILSDETKEKEAWKRQRCTLIACGASAFAEWLDAPLPGDRVFVAQYSGSKIETGDEVYWIINDEDVIGALADEGANP